MQSPLRVSLCVLATMSVGTGCSQSATIETERAKLAGTWEVVSWELREIQGPRNVGSQYEFFANGTVQVRSTTGEVSRKRKYELNVDTNPKQMDWSVTTIMPDKSTKEEATKGVYRFEGDTLIICMVMDPFAPRPTSFNTKDSKGAELLKLKRIPFADPDEERARNEAARARARHAAFITLQMMSVGQTKEGKFYLDFHARLWNRKIARKWWQDFLDLRDIAMLCFRGCTGVGDEQMRHLGKLTSLEILDLHSTDVGDEGVAQLGGLTNLEELDLSFTAVTDVGLAAISELDNLKRLSLNGSLVTEKGVQGLRMKRDDLDVVWLRPYTESQQQAALALSQLGLEIDEKFDSYLKPNTVTCRILFQTGRIRDPSVAVPDGPREPARVMQRSWLDPSLIADLLEKLPPPTAVRVRNEAMDDILFVCLRNIRGLVRLDAPSTQITDAGLAALKHHQTLKVLNLEHAKRITDAGVANLASLTNLEVLSLRRTKLTPEGLAKLLVLDHLQELHISRKQSNPQLDRQFSRKGVKVLRR